MSTNLSKDRREKMIKSLKEMRKLINDNPEMMSRISEIENELNKKKYGLVWEEHEENVDNQIKTKIPIFVEDKELEIKTGASKPINFLIEGDNLHSLYLLEKTHKEKIDVIYIDPPYNTGKKDFVYNDKIVNNDDSFRHSKWLSFMYNRLIRAKKLLKETGIVFISIDDNEQSQLKILCDEIFGENNFISMLSIENNPKGRKNSNFISICNEYCLIYAKNKNVSYFIENIPKNSSDVIQDDKGNFIHNSGKRVLVGENKFNDYAEDFNSDKHYTVYYNLEQDDMIIKVENEIDNKDDELLENGYQRYYSYNDNKFVLNTYSKNKLKELYEEEALEFKNSKIYEKNFSTMIRLKSLVINRQYDAIVNNEIINGYKIDVKTTSAGTELKNIFSTEEIPFSNPKNVGLIKLLLTLFENKNIKVLDFFAGSGTTGQAVIEQNKIDGGNRTFILCTNNEVKEEVLKRYAIDKKYIYSKREFNKFKETDDFIKMCKEDYIEENGICRAVTYERIRTIITGVRKDKSKYSQKIDENLKYYKTEYIDRFNSHDKDYYITQELSKYIKELVQLENGIDENNSTVQIIFTDEELDKFLLNEELTKKCKTLYLDRNAMIDGEHESELKKNKIKVCYIPEYYFENEIMEAEEW